MTETTTSPATAAADDVLEKLKVAWRGRHTKGAVRYWQRRIAELRLAGYTYQRILEKLSPDA